MPDITGFPRRNLSIKGDDREAGSELPGLGQFDLDP
jgi:hypothetical protein